jgi:uncharacterized protein (DUF2147 family)/surface polysaccharide O-acyltransferase-like enzyme
MDRRYDIDWLRVIATLLLFVFHGAMVFSPAPFYHIRNAELSMTLLVVAGFISLWHMPLFFLLAGWSLCRSLERRGARGVLRERMRRLGVPLVAGCIVFMPVIKYLELSSGLDLNYAGLRVTEAQQPGFRLVIPGGLPVAPEFTESFLTFLPTFFTRLERFTWAHLWFVAYLFTFTVVLMPLWGRLAARPSRRPPRSPAIAYLPIVPLALVQLALRERWPGIQNLFDDWANVGYYGTYLLAGFALARDPALEALAQREWRRALAVGTLACLPLLALVLRVMESPSVALIATAVAGWCFVLAALGLAHRFLDFGSAALHYLSEAAFPIYILHQVAIVVPGFFLVRFPLGIAAKFLLLVGVAAALTFAVYHWLVRPYDPIRFLFGMPPRLSPRPSPRPALAAALPLVVLLLTGSRSDATVSPIGRWYAEGGAAQVEIAPCGAALCGRVVWLRSPYDERGCVLTDRYNGDPRFHGRPVLGLEILRGLQRMTDDSWDEGTIYDPGSGRSYRCAATLDGSNRLLLRTATWLRVGAESQTCEAVPP